MKSDFSKEMIKKTFLQAMICTLIIAMNYGYVKGVALLAGATWSCANLYCIQLLLQNLVSEKKNALQIALAATVKFPLLYLTGYFMLTHFPLMYTLAGSLLIFVSLFLGSVKNMLGKTALFLIGCNSLHASLDTDAPEIPNIFTLLHHKFDTPLTAILHQWETFIFATIVAIVLSLIFYLAARNPKLVPDGLQNFVEAIVETLRTFIIDILGPQGEKFVPLLGTLFVYIVAMNWLAIVPFMKPPTSSINITIALALCVFALVQYLNIKNWGFWGFLYHMAGSPKGVLGWALVPLMLPIELLTQITRPLTLALRLFGNVVGEDILIGAGALFGVYLLSSSEFVGGLPMQLPFLMLAILTGLMQALVFTLLSTIYILLSMPEEEEPQESY